MISAVRAAPKSGTFWGEARLWRHSCAQALLHSYYHQSVTNGTKLSPAFGEFPLKSAI
jgi:hypothetical protein